MGVNRDNFDRLVLGICLIVLPAAAYRAYYHIGPVWLTNSALAALGIAILFSLSGHIWPNRD